MHVVTYTRVSTDDQTCDGQTIALQEFCAARNWTVVNAYTDKISGCKKEREGLDAMMASVRSGIAQAVVVVKIDRLARSLGHLAQMLSEFEKHKVAFVAITQGIDTTDNNPASKLQMHILGAIAEFERELIRERTKAGMRAAKERGAKFGNKSKVMVPNWEEVTKQWLSEGGQSVRELAWKLGGVSISTAWTKAKTVKAAQPMFPKQISGTSSN